MKVSEIEAVENIIRLLNECLIISIKNKSIAEIISTRKDLETCKRELIRLKIKAKEAAKN